MWHETGRPIEEIARLTPYQLAAVVFHARDGNGQLDWSAPAPATDPRETIRRELWRLGITDPATVRRYCASGRH